MLPLIHQYIAEGNNPDQPGRLVQWLYPRVPFYIWKVPGLWYDVGSLGNVGRGQSGVWQTVTIEPKHTLARWRGAEVYLYTLTNDPGIQVSITTYGGAIASLKVPDRNGAFGDIVLGFETLDEYVGNPRYFGALIGRHANRIAEGKVFSERSRISTADKTTARIIFTVVSTASTNVCGMRRKR